MAEKNEVDFIPSIGVSNDLMKISNAISAQPENLVLLNNVLNLLEMRQGMNKEFPDMGLAQELAGFSFNEISELELKLERLKEGLIKQTGHQDISIDYEIKNPELAHSDITIKILIASLPIPITMNIPNSIPVETKYAQ